MRARRFSYPAIAAAVLVALGGGATSSIAQDDGRNTRPLAVNQTEGFADGQVQVFTYEQNFFCTIEAFDDLVGPGSNGNGIPAAGDPLEVQLPRCIAGKNENGTSLPTMDPTGLPIGQVQRNPILVPSFDADRDLIVDSLDPTPGVQTQCPEPGAPTHTHQGAPYTCTMHPSIAFIEPVAEQLARSATGLPVPELPRDVPVGAAPLINHSHIVEETSNEAIWWHIVLFLVNDRSIWPDLNGICPAGPDQCLTSGEALRAAQARGQVQREIPTNIFLFFSVQPLQQDPAPAGPR